MERFFPTQKPMGAHSIWIWDKTTTHRFPVFYFFAAGVGVRDPWTGWVSGRENLAPCGVAFLNSSGFSFSLPPRPGRGVVLLKLNQWSRCAAEESSRGDQGLSASANGPPSTKCLDDLASSRTLPYCHCRFLFFLGICFINPCGFIWDTQFSWFWKKNAS